MDTICVTAESFGYGPIITCVNVIKALANKINVPFTFLGSGVALEQAKMSGLFADYIECETYLEDEVRKQAIFQKAKWIISFENPSGAICGIQENKHVFYVDNLFWMWDRVPKELHDVDVYFASETMDLDKNVERIGKPIKNFQKVGPLREFKKATSQEMDNRILINLGGAESFLEDHSTILNMYEVILRNFFGSLNGVFDGEIVVCGGNRVISALKERHWEKKVHFRSFSNAEYLEIMKKSKYLIMSPGLGNFYEVMSTSPEVFMLPPINYSQFLQLKNYIQYDVGITTLNWDAFDWYVRVPDYISEDEGVSLVKENCDLFICETESQKVLCRKMLEYISDGSSNCITKRKAFIEKCNRNGIDEVSEAMARRLYNGNVI